MKYALPSIITVLCHVPSIVGLYQDETRNIMPEVPYPASSVHTTNSTITLPIVIILDLPDEQESLVVIDSHSAQQPVSSNDVNEHSGSTDLHENTQSVTIEEEDTAADSLNQTLDVCTPYTLFHGFKMLNSGVEDDSQQLLEGQAECTPIPNENNADQGSSAISTRPETDLDDHGTESHNMMEQRCIETYTYCIDTGSNMEKCEEIMKHSDLLSSSESSDTADVQPSRPSIEEWKLNLNGYFEAPGFETHHKVTEPCFDMSFPDQTSPTPKCKEPSEKNKLPTYRDAYNPQANDQFCSDSLTDNCQAESAGSDEDTGTLSSKYAGALSEPPTTSTNTTVCTNSSLVERVAVVKTKLTGLMKLICTNHKYFTVIEYTRLLNYQLSMRDCVNLMMMPSKTNTQSILHREATVNSCEKLLKNLESLFEGSFSISDPAQAADPEKQFLLLNAEHSALKRNLKIMRSFVLDE